MTLCAFVLCSAISGIITAYREKPIAGFLAQITKWKPFCQEFCQLAERSTNAQICRKLYSGNDSLAHLHALVHLDILLIHLS